MFLINARRRKTRTRGRVPAWLLALDNGGKTMARRNPRRRKRRKTSRSKRSAAARKAARTRARNKAKRSAAGRKAARTRRRNAKRRNPSKRRSSGVIRSTTRSIKSLTRPKTWTANAKAGLGLSAGYAAVNALRAVESRFGLDSMLAMLPGGMVGKVAEYGVKIVNISLATQLARMVAKGKVVAHVQYGGLTNLGISLLGDVSTLFGGTGEIVRGYLGDYNLAYGGQAMGAGPSLGNYNLLGGGQAMPSVSSEDFYGSFGDVY